MSEKRKRGAPPGNKNARTVPNPRSVAAFARIDAETAAAMNRLAAEWGTSRSDATNRLIRIGIQNAQNAQEKKQ